MNSWYKIQAKADGEYEVAIYDEIGFFGISAKQFLDDFKKIPNEAPVILRINSPGGDVFDSLAIHNVIKRHAGEVNATVDGIAASGASLVLMAANRVTMPANSFLMIHNVAGGVYGNADDMREWADVLEKLDSGLVATYVSRTGQSAEKIREMLADETWLTAAEAQELGFADEVTDAVKLAANANSAKFKNLPEALKTLAEEAPVTDPPPAVPTEEAAPPPPAPSSEPEKTEEEISAAATEAANKRAQDILDACTKAGVAEAASEFLNRGLGADEVRAKLADANKIRARCAAAKVPERANGYIKAGMSVTEVANDLFDVLIAKQGPEIDGRLTPRGFLGATEKPGGQKNSFDPEAIQNRYREREQKYWRKP